MAEPTATGRFGQTSVSQTPFEMTNEYQDHLREENRQRHVTTFYGIVPRNGTRDLTTYLGDFKGPGHLRAVLTSYNRMDLTMPAPDPGSLIGRLRSVGGIFSRAMLLDQVKGLMAPPADLMLSMKILHPGGRWEGLYYSNLLMELDCGPAPLPMSATITLRNPNPVQDGVFAFNLAFPVAGA